MLHTLPNVLPLLYTDGSAAPVSEAFTLKGATPAMR